MPKDLSIWILSGILLVGNAVGAEPSQLALRDTVRQLESDEDQVRAAAEARLIGLHAEAVEALIHAACQDRPPSRKLSDATLRILEQWEQKSWTDADSAAAVDKFVRLARETENCWGEHPPLSPNSVHPFAEKVRVLDVSPDEAAAYLRGKKGVTVSQDQYGFYRSVQLKSDWTVDPKDWLYIANLAREIKGTPYVDGKRHPIGVSVTGRGEADALVECFKFFRKSQSSPFDLFVWEAPINREALLVLGTYPQLTGMSANQGIEDITDEDWAACISRWPNANYFTLLPTGGRKAIAAASTLDHLYNLTITNLEITEPDLQPLRKSKKLRSLWVWDGTTHVQYLNQEGTGKWQVEE